MSRAASIDGWRLASLKHTLAENRRVRWWGPENRDYVESLDEAGCYDLDTLRGSPYYYGSPALLCVPDHVARRLAGGGCYVRNTARTWATLRLASLFEHAWPWAAPCKPQSTTSAAARRRRDAAALQTIRAAVWEAEALASLALACEDYPLLARVRASCAVVEEDIPGLTPAAASFLAERLRELLYRWAAIHGLTPRSPEERS